MKLQTVVFKSKVPPTPRLRRTGRRTGWRTGKGQRSKVFVGLSGGVDSSVSAALLLEQGFDVEGVFIKVWEPDWLSCTSKEDRLDAMRVCAKLGIPFRTINLEKEYKKEVVDYMIEEYRAGRTPNPDVMCNKHVKFGAFYNWGIRQGADFVATGHYARVPQSGTREALSYTLLAGLDQEKDQSYFLWNLKQEQLPHVLFPVGHLKKTEVRKLAKKFGLVTATKKDSQGLCFLGKVDVKDFLSHYVKSRPGNVMNEKGEVVGRHIGAIFYTIGERHGFTITKKTPTDKPYYIFAKDIKKNTVSVSEKTAEGLLPKSLKVLMLENVNWIGEAPALGRKISGRIRYRADLENCRLTKINLKKSSATVAFDKPVLSATSGQSLVLYDGETCLGGGVIR